MAIRILSFLLLIYIVDTALSSKKATVSSSFHRRNREISLNEYLVPPPPPQLQHHSVRTGRLTNPKPTEAPGYFSRLMSMFNPFSYGTSYETPPSKYRSLGSFNPPLNPSSVIHKHEPSSKPRYFPPPTANKQAEYLPPNKGKICNPCNKIPWVPMGGPSVQSLSPSTGYLPPSHREISHDAQHAPSQEVRISNILEVPSQQNGQAAKINPRPNPHLYPTLMPPFREAEPFDRRHHNIQEQHTQHTELLPSPSEFGVNEQYYAPPINQRENFNALDTQGNQDSTSSDTSQYKNSLNNLNRNLNRLNVHGERYFGPLDSHKTVFSVLDVHNNQHMNLPINQEATISIDNAHNGQDLTSGDTRHYLVTTNQDPIFPGDNRDLTSSATQNNESYANAITQNPGSGFSAELSKQQELFDNSYSKPNKQNTSAFKKESYVQRESNNAISFSTFGSNMAPSVQKNYPSLESNSDNVVTGLSAPARFRTFNINVKGIDDLKYRNLDGFSPVNNVIRDSLAAFQPSDVNHLSTINETPIHFEEAPLLDLTKNDDNNSNNDSSDDIVGITSSHSTRFADILLDNHDPTRSTESHLALENVQFFYNNTQTSFANNKNFENEKEYFGNQDISDSPPNGPSRPVPSNLLLNNPEGQLTETQEFLRPQNEPHDNFTKDVHILKSQSKVQSEDSNGNIQKQQSTKKSKQVQVIIPYTSEYTPIPFQQIRDWSVKSNIEHTQPRKYPSLNEETNENYIRQLSGTKIGVITELQYNFTTLNNLDTLSTTPSIIITENDTKKVLKANNTIDVHRLQKNIDNWTIQEYSTAKTSSTVIPNPLHVYLSPSKKIPDDYLTTTEPGERIRYEDNDKGNVKSYTLAGFSFNDLDHEGSASSHVEGARIQVVQGQHMKSPLKQENHTPTSTLRDESTWKVYPVTISPINKERIYVITPQSVPTTNFKSSLHKETEETNDGNTKYSKKLSEIHVKKNKTTLTDFETIEKVYQVLPQAVNNLAVASTGKDSIPLWGIMEHEEFALLNTDEDNDSSIDRPVLYSGHSKVSRAKR